MIEIICLISAICFFIFCLLEADKIADRMVKSNH